MCNKPTRALFEFSKAPHRNQTYKKQVYLVTILIDLKFTKLMGDPKRHRFGSLTLE